MFDLLLRGGRVIDPVRNFDAIADVGLRDGVVAAVGPSLPDDGCRDVRDVSGRLVLPGIVDLHTHVYWGGTSLGVDAEEVAYDSVTATLVDAGSAGPGNFPGFRRHVIERVAPRVLSYINVSFAGIFGFSDAVRIGECEDVRLLNVRECVRVAREHADVIVGVKVRVGMIAGGGSSIAPLDIAIEAAEELGLPVMTHLDFPPPTRREVLERLRRGDILTHCFRSFPNAPSTRDGAVREEVLAARERGVLFDVGHGRGAFGFGTARAMLANGFMPDVISSDLHALCIAPDFDLLITMSKFLCLGIPLADVVRCVTSAPASALRRKDLGSLEPGVATDVSIVELLEGDFEYRDVDGVKLAGRQKLARSGIVLKGRWWDGPADRQNRPHAH
ncbi:amidohydrolase/deacetylase family metallohydrolase [Chelativorans sp. AA-79]|uniref:amidohydrolase/deacetylase family metallohydrolase n=1 Tax=Chelativorans sp. AA-79 TaxID=3028735 RepID=UPI0023FA3AEF|nr:amidohydrolase/deacetylase family metallohydrolase [Chelativorans sp. AA-79]WEX12422.1 amidohydrolase/deacetylase family metallohydrolase [Chelativorans sp. AA-79]